MAEHDDGHVTTSQRLLLDINDIFYTFGAFMAVLIAVEIFINIRLYLGTNVFPVQLVVATALMAIARKVIVLDFDTLTPHVSDWYCGDDAGAWHYLLAVEAGQSVP